MTFLYPTFLWALLGLTVPIAIHLWSKKEGRTIKIGSIQLLRESDPKQTSNLKLNEIWLLLLRLLLITTLVFILAEPQWKTEGENVTLTYIVEPSLLNFEEVYTMIDTLAESGAVVKLLESGFPEFEHNLPYTSSEIPNYWQLASEMQEMETDSVVVFTNAFQTGFKGKRPQASKNINWVLLDPGTTSENFVYATHSGNTVELLSAKVEAENLKFEKMMLPLSSDNIMLNEQKDSITISASGKEYEIPLKTEDSLSVFIYYEEDFSAEMKYIRASFSALSKHLQRSIEITASSNFNENVGQSFTAAVLLGQTQLPKEFTSAKIKATRVLMYEPDSLASSIITASGITNTFYLTTRLDSENVLQQHLPEKMFALLDLYPGLQENVQEYDRRVMDRSELLPVPVADKSGRDFLKTINLTNYLWLLLLCLLLAERGLAYYRKQ